MATAATAAASTPTLALLSAAATPTRLALLATALVVAHQFYKSLPGMYHVRATLAMLYERFVARGRMRTLDDVVACRGRVALCDLDWFGHQNNTVYTLDADVARYAWFLRFLSNSGDPAAYKRLRFANSGGSFFFYKEMLWGHAYTLETRCVGCDEKWIFLQHKFIDERLRASEGGGVHAVGLARFVFKEARGSLAGKTVAPHEVFNMLNFAVPKEWDVAPCVAGRLFGELGDAQYRQPSLREAAARKGVKAA